MVISKDPGRATSSKDARVAKAVQMKHKYPDMLLPQAMRAAGFVFVDSVDPAKQMWIRRRLDKEKLQQVPSMISVGQGSGGSVSSLTRTPPGPGAVKKQPRMLPTRLSAVQKQKKRTSKKLQRDHYSAALKHATRWYASERSKDRGLSAYTVAEKVKELYDGVGPCERTLQRHYLDGRIGMSPKKPGPCPDIPRSVFKLLCSAWESFVRIQQINGLGGNNTRKKLAAAVNGVVRDHGTKLKYFLLSKVLDETALNIAAIKTTSAEERRI